jgi:hypothetical protein
VRKILFEKGFQAKDSDTGSSFSLETESQTADGKMVRYLVQGVKVDDSSCRVEFTKMSSGAKGTSSNRDLEMEWQLLERADAASAQQIKTAAEAEGNKAKTQS